MVMKFEPNSKFENYKIRTLTKNDRNEIQTLCECCNDYFFLEQGSNVKGDEWKNILEDLPSNKNYDEKYVLGIVNHLDRLVGLMDLIEDCPEENIWMLGLLLINPSERRTGLGRHFHNTVVHSLKKEDGEQVRLGVLLENSEALEFWQALGYKIINQTQIKLCGVNRSIYVMAYKI